MDKAYLKQNPWKNSLYCARQRCNNSNNPRYADYGGKGISCYLTMEQVKKLWFRDKAYQLKRPSLDRIKPEGNYSFDNCQFIERDINSVKDRYKPIGQFTLSGQLVKHWKSQTTVSKELNIPITSISNALRGCQKTAHGFIWRYK